MGDWMVRPSTGAANLPGIGGQVVHQGRRRQVWVNAKELKSSGGHQLTLLIN
jgi:hypothetical protein